MSEIQISNFEVSQSTKPVKKHDGFIIYKIKRK